MTSVFIRIMREGTSFQEDKMDIWLGYAKRSITNIRNFVFPVFRYRSVLWRKKKVKEHNKNHHLKIIRALEEIYKI